MNYRNYQPSQKPALAGGSTVPTTLFEPCARRVVRPLAVCCIAAFSTVLGFAADLQSPAAVADRNAGTVISLGTEIFSSDSAFTLQVDQAFRIGERGVLIAELYGAKGESDFGILSGGLTYRSLIGDSGTFAGINVFYDALQDTAGFSYSQLGFGADITHGRYTLRGNYYLPVGDSDRSTFVGSTPSANIFELREATHGWDAELAVSLVSKPAFFEPVVAVGYFGRYGDGVAGDYSGVKARGGFRLGEHMFADVEWRQDGRGLGQEWRVGVRFEFKFGGPRSKGSAPTYRSRLPAVAMGDGKSVHPLESGDGKSIRPLAGSDGKSAMPLDGRAAPLDPGWPRGFADPPRRTRWPTVLTGYYDPAFPGVAAGSFGSGGGIPGFLGFGAFATGDPNAACACEGGGGAILRFD